MTFFELLWLLRGEIIFVLLVASFGIIGFNLVGKFFDKKKEKKIRITYGIIGILLLYLFWKRWGAFEYHLGVIENFYNKWYQVWRYLKFK